MVPLRVSSPMLATGPRHDPALVHYLARYDTPCPRCEYNLRSLTILICPECGLSIGWPALLDRPIPLKRRIAIAGVCIATLLLIASATALYSGATVGIAIFAGGTLLLAWAPLLRWAWPFISAPGVPPDMRVWRVYIALVRAFVIVAVWLAIISMLSLPW